MGRLVTSKLDSGGRAISSRISEETPAPSRATSSRSIAGGAAGGITFRAELDISEIDTRGRPGAIWTGRAATLSRSQMSFLSRRMCYEGRELLLAVHLVDDRPVPLYGMVSKSEYDGDGLYRTNVNLLPLPETESIRNWINHLQHRPVI